MDENLNRRLVGRVLTPLEELLWNLYDLQRQHAQERFDQETQYQHERNDLIRSQQQAEWEIKQQIKVARRTAQQKWKIGPGDMPRCPKCDHELNMWSDRFPHGYCENPQCTEYREFEL